MSEKMKFSRRTFIGVVGTAIGATAIAANLPSMGAPPQPNKPTIDGDSFIDDALEADVLVIGSGIAGLLAAVKAHDAGAKVMMVSKGRLGSSGLTPFGKGVFAYDKNNAKISPEEYLAKVADFRHWHQQPSIHPTVVRAFCGPRCRAD